MYRARLDVVLREWFMYFGLSQRPFIL
ncbi:hypothetical protein F383_24352 [Gossypium arboreum]|uniref:Uncharacterized protein n=1 Tax=Gossypium arboreum TaxID=29729 RepID=A0A0B0P0A1_GOSAR|nr:hypothetical protein F383_24352 [Gossypium arboreum]